MECGGDKHPDAHDSWIAYFNAHFGRAQRRIEHRRNIADASGEYLIGICVQADFRRFAYMHVG